jgi:hypothetical protein
LSYCAEELVQRKTLTEGEKVALVQQVDVISLSQTKLALKYLFKENSLRSLHSISSRPMETGVS